jgi:hypothetical protein
VGGQRRAAVCMLSILRFGSDTGAQRQQRYRAKLPASTSLEVSQTLWEREQKHIPHHSSRDTVLGVPATPVRRILSPRYLQSMFLGFQAANLARR